MTKGIDNMASVNILVGNEKPEISLDDGDIFLEGDPLVVLHYSGFQVFLSKSAFLHLKQALKCGEGMLENYRRFMEEAETLPLF